MVTLPQKLKIELVHQMNVQYTSEFSAFLKHIVVRSTRHAATRQFDCILITSMSTNLKSTETLDP